MAADMEMIGILQDLIRINKDRAEGYRKAVTQLTPEDLGLAALFNTAASTSHTHAEILGREVISLLGSAIIETPRNGKLYRLWMDIKSGVTARDRKTILSLVEFGEDAALRAYKLALESEVKLPRELEQLIREQKSAIQHSHDMIKRYRDQREAIHP